MDHTFGIRFQFDCVSSSQGTGCLSKVWELVKSFGNLISLGGGGVSMDASLEINCSASAVFPDSTFSWAMSDLK